MKFNKKFLSIFFIALLAVVLVACGGTTTAAPTTAAPTTAAPTTVAPTTVAPTTQAPTTVPPTTAAPTTTEAPVDWVTIEEALRAHYSETLDNDEFVATADLTLIATISDATIEWSSSDTTYLGHDGTVTQPAFATGDQTVILTATLTIGAQDHDVMFFVTIDALAKTDAERAAEALAAVMVFPFKEKWSSADSDSLDFLTTAQDADGESYEVVWTSSHPEYIAVDGTIVQPMDEDIVVTMTATLTINEVEFSQTKDFTVSKMEEGTPVSTIAAAVAMGDGAYVKILGVTVIAKYASGDVFFTDGVDILYIYTPTFTSEVGGVYDITGIMDYYYNAPQLTGDDTHPLRAEASTETVKAAPVQVMAGILDVIADQTMPTPENLFQYKTYTVTAKIYVNSAWGNYSVFLVPSNYDFEAPLATGATQPNGDSIMIYYKSDMSVLAAFHGQEVNIDILTQGWRSDKSVWYANFFGTAADVEINITDDQEAVDTVLDAISFPNSIIEDTTLALIKSLYGATVAYSSTNEAVINPTTGVVTVTGLTEQTSVTLTATVTRGEATATADFVIKVGPLPMSDVADVYTTLVGDLIKVTGILTTDIKPAQYFFQDATAGIALDVYSMQTAFAAIPIGSEIVITGSVDMSNGLYEINVLDYEVLSTAPALPTPADINAVPFTNEALLAYQGQLVAFSGFVLKDNPKDVGYGTYEFVLMDVLTEEEILVRLDNRSLGYLDAKTELLTLVPGDEVVITGAVLGWYKGYQLLISDADQFEKGTNGLTNAQKIQLDLAKMSETLRLSEDFVFVTGLYGTTFEVQNVYGFAANYVDYTTTVGTLAVTNPYAYDAYGLLVVIATNGSDELEVEFDLVVESLSINSLTDDLFFSEYGEGSSNNKWLEIYNGTGADVDLSNYSIQYYNNGATAVTQTLVLSGTLVAGDVLVLTTDAANQLIKDEADGIYAYPSVVHYNGDDAVALLNGTAIIDLIGVIGEDPGASWPVGTGATAEFTLVRKPAILAPNATFTADEWLVYPQDTFTYIGSHEVDTIELTNEIKVLSDKAKLAELEDVFYAETTISLPVLGDLGSQISWTIKTDEGTNAVLVGADLTLAQVADDTTAQVVMEATLTLGEGEEAATSTVLVTFILVGQTDADKLASAIADINTGIDDDCDGYEVVVLPTSGLFGTTITWALVSGEATLDGSTITFAQTSAVGTVVLDATFVTGTATETVRYTINVTPVEIITDFSLIPAMADTTPVFVQGVVTGLSYDGAFLQDANGVGFFMYGPGSKAELAIGDEVIYKGNIASYKDAKQLASGILLEELSAGNALIYNTVTADEIHAFAIGDAGSLFTFDGFVFKGVEGSTMTLGYTLADGLTTGTVTIRYYSNWADLVLVANNYAIDDTIPAVNFILYNFRDGLKQLDVLNIPTLAPAIEALDDSVEAAITYEYVPVYEYHFETSVKTGNNIHNEYLQSALLAANPADMYEGVMFDLARYLGALYRATGSTIVAIQYDGAEYFWNETIGLLGSNWVDDLDTTLVSVLVADFQAEVLTDSVVLVLVDSEGFVYVLELTFNITMDLDEAIEATIENAILFEYVAPDAYTYYYETSVYTDMTLTTVYLLENVSVDSHEIMWDMARFLGALYRVQDSNVASIVYKGQEYTWNELLGLHGSNWAYNDGAEDITLVSVIVADFQAALITDTVTLTLKDANGYSIDIDLTFSVEGEVIPEPELLFSYNFFDGGDSSNNAYASTNLLTNVSYAADNPGGTTGTSAWTANYANLSLTTGTRLGGKLVSTEYSSPSANISTNFTFSNVITQVEILSAATFGTAGNVGNVYLQTSTDGTTWTTVSTYTTALSSTATTITFADLNIASGAYLRVVVAITASGSNSGMTFMGIKVTGFAS